MKQLFLNLVNISVTASWIVLAVVLLRFALRKAPKWITCLLWVIVGLRLIMPFSLESVFSLIPRTEVIDTATYQVQTGVGIIDDTVNGYLDSYYKENVNIPKVDDTNVPVDPGTDVPVNQGGATSTNAPVDIMTVVSGIWVAGMAVMAAYSVISYLRLRRRVAASIHCRNQVYFCDDIPSAFILGIIRPRIYLPSGMTEEQMSYVIRHEKAHLSRKDHLWKPLGFALLTVYWFNPILWVAYILLCRDIEMACDEHAVRDMDTEAKKGYSEALMACSVQRRMIMACPLAFGEVAVKDRIKSVLHYKKPAFWVILTALVVCVTAAVCFLTNPVEKGYSYQEVSAAYEALQVELEEKETTEEGDYLAYAELFRMIAQGAKKETDRFAELTREITNDGVDFKNEEVFDLAESYADAYTALAAGKEQGVQNLKLNSISDSEAVLAIDYLGEIRYGVKLIEVGEPWNCNDRMVPYNGELGEYVLEIGFGDSGVDSSFTDMYSPDAIHKLGSVFFGSEYGVMLKWIRPDVESDTFYIGCDMPLSVEEHTAKEENWPIGSVSITMSFLTDMVEDREPLSPVFKLSLSDKDKDALIKAYYDWRSTQQGVYFELAWEDFSDTAEKGRTYSGYRYYGTFGDCIVWFRGGVSGTATETEIAGSVFAHPYYADYYAYCNGTLYTLQQAYEQGMVLQEDIATVAGYHAAYNAAAAKNPNAVVMELPLTPENELEIKQTYLSQLEDPGNYTVDNLPLRVISNYEGVCAVWIGKSASVFFMVTQVQLKKPELEGKATGAYVFTFPDSDTFRIYANNRIYGIEQAWDEGILTAEHVELLLKGNRYLHKYFYPKDWKS